MEVKVVLHNLRTAPRKSREVIDLIRGKNVAQARSILEFTVKKSSEPIRKLLKSGVSSAVNDFKLKESDLYISKITVDEGPKLKRMHPMSRGRAYPIMKRTSHITLILSEVNEKNNKDKDKKERKQDRVKMKNANIKVQNENVKSKIKKQK